VLPGVYLDQVTVRCPYNSWMCDLYQGLSHNFNTSFCQLCCFTLISLWKWQLDVILSDYCWYFVCTCSRSSSCHIFQLLQCRPSLFHSCHSIKYLPYEVALVIYYTPPVVKMPMWSLALSTKTSLHRKSFLWVGLNATLQIAKSLLSCQSCNTKVIVWRSPGRCSEVRYCYAMIAS